MLANSTASRSGSSATRCRASCSAGRFHFPEIALSGPHFSLEVDKDGKANWVFRDEDQGMPSEFPKIGTLTIDHGSARYRDPRINTDLAVEMSTRPGSGNEPESMVDVTGKGRHKGLATTIKGSGGALLSLRDEKQPYPINANVVMGSTRARGDDTVPGIGERELSDMPPKPARLPLAGSWPRWE